MPGEVIKAVPLPTPEVIQGIGTRQQIGQMGYDYPRLIGMIDFDSINYSPPKTFLDTEIAYLLDLVRKGC